MDLSRRQTAERLGITVAMVNTLQKRGDLVDVNTKPGRHQYRFDSRAVEDYRKARKNGYHQPVVAQPLPPPPPPPESTTSLLAARRHMNVRVGVADAPDPAEFQRTAMIDALNRIADNLERLVAAWK